MNFVVLFIENSQIRQHKVHLYINNLNIKLKPVVALNTNRITVPLIRVCYAYCVKITLPNRLEVPASAVNIEKLVNLVHTTIIECRNRFTPYGFRFGLTGEKKIYCSRSILTRSTQVRTPSLSSNNIIRARVYDEYSLRGECVTCKGVQTLPDTCPVRYRKLKEFQF